MADEFAGMLNGVSGRDLLSQWDDLAPLTDSIRTFTPRPILLVTAGNDSIFPSSRHVAAVAGLPGLQWVENAESDHSFSACRSWLVQTVTDWLIATI
jgi:hypothetical protein